MAISSFNAITYANKLKEAGMATRIADVQAEEMSEFINSTLATKRDIEVLRKDIEILRMELQAFIVKALIGTVSVLGVIQGIFHFM